MSVYRDDGSRFWSAEDAINIVRMIDVLRNNDGDAVTIPSDNPDFNGQPNCMIICNGMWTGWQDRRFQHDEFRECLRMAVEAKATIAAAGGEG